MAKERELAEQILKFFGGKDNITSANFCMTRLRLTAANKDLVDNNELKNIAGVIGLVESSGQYQMVLGPDVVNKVAAEVTLLTGIQMGEVQDLKAGIDDKNHTPFKLFLRKLSSIFIPLIPAIVASGMISGITNVAVRSGMDPKALMITILNTLGSGIFVYLAIFVGINAAKEFGGTPAMGGLAGVLLINPAIANIHIAGAALVPGRGGIIGVLIVAWFMCWVEKQLRKVIPNSIDIIVTPALTLLITGFATYYIL